MKPPRRLFRRHRLPPDIREIRADSQEEPQRFRARSSPEADAAFAAGPEDAATVLPTFPFARHKGLDLVTADRGVFDLAGKARDDPINIETLPEPLRRIREGGTG